MNCQIYKGPPYVPVKSVDLVGWPHKYQKDLSWRISTANPLLLVPKCYHLIAFQLGLETDPKTTHSGMKTKGSFIIACVELASAFPQLRREQKAAVCVTGPGSAPAWATYWPTGSGHVTGSFQAECLPVMQVTMPFQLHRSPAAETPRWWCTLMPS